MMKPGTRFVFANIFASFVFGSILVDATIKGDKILALVAGITLVFMHLTLAFLLARLGTLLDEAYQLTAEILDERQKSDELHQEALRELHRRNQEIDRQHGWGATGSEYTSDKPCPECGGKVIVNDVAVYCENFDGGRGSCDYALMSG